MNRARCVLLKVVLSLSCIFMTSCGGGPSSSLPPPPNSNPVPAISAVTPSSVLAGSADTPVIITGSGFVSSSAVQWNGSPIAATFSSATTLNATIPASSLTTATIAKLTVTNPAPGGGTFIRRRFFREQSLAGNQHNHSFQRARWLLRHSAGRHRLRICLFLRDYVEWHSAQHNVCQRHRGESHSAGRGPSGQLGKSRHRTKSVTGRRNFRGCRVQRKQSSPGHHRDFPSLCAARRCSHHHNHRNRLRI